MSQTSHTKRRAEESDFNAISCYTEHMPVFQLHSKLVHKKVVKDLKGRVQSSKQVAGPTENKMM